MTNKSIYLLLLATFYISVAFGQYEKSEFERLMEVKDRKTIIHDDGSRETFVISEKSIRTKNDRIYYGYHGQKILKTQGSVSGKILNGSYESYHPNKQLQETGKFKNGLKIGVWKIWKADGSLIREDYWKNGSINGLSIHYKDNMLIDKKGEMKNGKWEGKVLVFQPANNNYKISYFEQGKHIDRTTYIQGNLFRRTAEGINILWNKLFHRRDNPSNTPKQPEKEKQ